MTKFKNATKIARAAFQALRVFFVLCLLCQFCAASPLQAFAAPARTRSGSANAAARAGKAISTKIAGGANFPVYYRKALPLDAAKARYPGFRKERAVLRAGTQRVPEGRRLICDIMFERDVPIRLRDGVTIYADVFRPVYDGRCPAIICLTPFGKEIGSQLLDDIPGRLGIPKDVTSGLECFGGLDPVFWVAQGYAIVNVDARGSYSSNGNITMLGQQFAEDGYDIVEWAAVQPWCSGRVGMAGALGLASAQWFVAAELPPHLEAIAPWCGITDLYRQVTHRGGIPAPALCEALVELLASQKGHSEDLPQMIVRYPFMNAYWADKAARLQNINLPAYIVAGWCTPESLGSLEGYRNIPSSEKWLRVHASHPLFDLYSHANVTDLARFFDYYLRDANNGWERTPRVRMSLLELTGREVFDRPEADFPLPYVQETCFYLNTRNSKLERQLPQLHTFSYNSEDERSYAVLTYTFDRRTEICGYLSLHLWASALDADDLELAVSVEKLGSDGEVLNANDFGPVVATGRIRASMREVDEHRTSRSLPYLKSTNAQKLEIGVPVPLEISISPLGMIFRPGESLRLTVRPYFSQNVSLPFGTAKVTIPRDSFTTFPKSNDSAESGEVYALNAAGEPIVAAQQAADETVTLGGGSEPYDESLKVAAPELLNKGAHIIYTGGKYDSYLLIPLLNRN